MAGTAPDWMTWYRNEVASLPGRDPTTVFIGDSITFAWASTGAASWAALARYRPVDLGVPGDTTQNVLWRIGHGELHGLHPSVVVAMIGTNNLGHYPAGDVVRGVEAVVAALGRALPSARIVLLGVLPIDPGGTARHMEVALVDDALAGRYRTGPVTYLDLRSDFAGADGSLHPQLYHPVCLTGTSFCDQLVHPSARGYAVMTEALAPILDRLVGPGG